MLSIRHVFTTVYLCGYSRFVPGCPTNCVSCIGNSDTCQRCVAGYWLDKTICTLCPGRCSECFNSTHCSKCIANRWNTNCLRLCYANCDGNGCDDLTGYCTECKSGFYGSYCSGNCKLCNYQSCGLHTCTDGCIDGYFEPTSGDTISCQPCHHNCAVCEHYYYCLKCNNGFYKQSEIRNGILEAYCYPCQQHCEECTDYNKCTVCKPGAYGTRCEKTCKLFNCHRCKGSRGIEKCTECEAGYRLDENECVPCVSINGICTDECTAGYWGEYCNKKCHEGCVSCNQTYGHCDVCHRNRYGEYCQFTCNEHCHDDGSVLNLCIKKTGKCELGCEDGYSGHRCDVMSFTISFEYFSPTTQSKSVTKMLEESNQLKKAWIIGANAGGGVSVIAVVVVVIVCVVRRRNRQTTSSRKSVIEVREYENTAVTMHVVSSDETGVDIGNVGCNQNTVETVLSVYEIFDGDSRDDHHQYTGSHKNTTETVASVYERLDGDTRDDHHQYSGLERQTDQHGTSYVNI